MSSLIVIYDSLYVLLRAMTMKTGVYGKYFSAYEMYTRYDKLYLKLDDYFLVLHSWFNLFEAALMLLTILLSLSSGNVRRQFVAAILTIFVSAFSLCKTAIYLFYDRGFISE